MSKSRTALNAGEGPEPSPLAAIEPSSPSVTGRSQPAPRWRSIETAPKNEYVLVFCPDAAEYTQIMICGQLEGDGDPGGPDWYELNCDARPCPLDVEPTHWTPLPSAPDKAVENASAETLLTEAVKALEPFAQAAEMFSWPMAEGDLHPIATGTRLSVGDLRRARATLSKIKAEAK